jgi:hypothetical protein
MLIHGANIAKNLRITKEKRRKIILMELFSKDTKGNRGGR